jgi:3-hydroxyisobutyrate dehydrogenase-like beta-hydroxyacid dehydrogenase
MANLGFIGHGIMGGRIVKRLLAAGHTVTGYTRTRTKSEGLERAGMKWADTPRQVAEASAFTFSMVTDSHALETIARGPDGVLAGLGPGKIYVDMSTVNPELVRALAKEAQARGADMLDAPVSGSIPAVEAGTLAFMVGGNAETLKHVEPILMQLGQKITHMGDNGSASLMKIAVNLSLPIQLLAVYEGVLLAEKGGIPRERALEVILNSAVASPSLKFRAPLAFNPPAEVAFTIAMMQKDITLALNEGHKLGVPLFTPALSGEMLTAARALGYSNEEFSALYEVLARLTDASK